MAQAVVDERITADSGFKTLVELGAELVEGADTICPIERIYDQTPWEASLNPTSWGGQATWGGQASPRLSAWSLAPAFFPRPPALFTTDVVANVYLADPREVIPTEVVLKDLVLDGTRLEGPYAIAGSERLEGAAQANLDNGIPNFRFLPDTVYASPCNTDVSACTLFDAVNVYYHIDRYVRDYWLDQLQFEPTFQAVVAVHGRGDGAYATTEGFGLKFRLGDIFMKNTALSRDIILHEYNHLVASSLGFVATSDHNDQARALAEGYADYFTASFTEDPVIGEWVVTCPDRAQCQGLENDTDLRTLLLSKEIWNWKFGYPSEDLEYGYCLRFHTGDRKCKATYTNFTNTYVWGMIWAAMLWDLRVRFGDDMVDRIALKAMSKHTGSTTFQTAVEDFFQSTELVVGTQHHAEIKQLFAARGFLTPSIVGIEEETIPQTTLTSWPNPARDVVHFMVGQAAPSGAPSAAQGGAFRGSPGRTSNSPVHRVAGSAGAGVGTIHIRWYDILGRRIQERSVNSQHVGPQQITEDVSGFKAGLYLVTIQSPNGLAQQLVTVSR